MPLCATVASESIFEAFLGSEKRDALLHGHSYTAHAVGCKVAEAAVRELVDMEGKGVWGGFRSDWAGAQAEPDIWSNWSKSFVSEISHANDVESVVAIGSLLAISLHDHSGASEFPPVSGPLSASPNIITSNNRLRLHGRKHTPKEALWRQHRNGLEHPREGIGERVVLDSESDGDEGDVGGGRGGR